MSKRKAPKKNPNSEFCEFLIELADNEKNVEKNMFKSKAYRKAASVLANNPDKISSGAKARKLPGIGDKIAKKIDEFIKTGKLEKLEKVRASSSAVAINQLTRVSGIGPTAAKRLVEEGIHSIDELKKAVDKLNHHQKIGLQHLEDFEARIPRSEMKLHEKIIRERTWKNDKDFITCICGSYRRGAESSGDIDVLVAHPLFTSHTKEKVPVKKNKLQSLIENLKKSGYITDTISSGDSKFMGVCRLDGNDWRFRRLDVRLIPYDQYHFGVLYFTGSDIFNQSMRKEALDQGFTLNEYCIRPLGSTGDPGEPIPVECEKDIFDIIQKSYVEPTGRNL